MFKQEHCVAFYAQRLNISTGHLNDLSKTHLGVSAKKYIIRKIITEAQKMLTLTDFPIAEIALIFGFVDTSYFVRRFKTETGETPLAFRRNQNL
jgi:AraC-like DNA-binding protein